MSHAAIQIDHVGKRYRIGSRKQRKGTIASALTSWVTSPMANLAALRGLTTFTEGKEESDVLWALKDISFAVQRGEVVGLIGRNGAGKSTMLKVLAQITDPSTGCAMIRGRVGSLLEVGTGFHPELTGRENVYLNGTILGMRKSHIDRRFEEIVEFSGVAKFIDTPVKRYSSGMKVRLAFSVAAHLEAEILLVDEVLAVGDAEFQQKCLGKMDAVATSGRTVIFVSHQMSAVKNLCTRGIVFESGTVAFDGGIDRAIDHYLRSFERAAGASLDNEERVGSGAARVIGVDLLNAAGNAIEQPVSGEPLRIALTYECPQEPPPRMDARLSIYNDVGVAVAHFDTKWTHATMTSVAPRGTIFCDIPRLPLPLGRYRIATALAGSDTFDHLPSARSFVVETCLFFQSGAAPDSRKTAVLMDHSWGATGETHASP